jgi:hypothetical protein
MNDRAARVRVVGPLARYADGFAAVLAQRGYAPSSAAWRQLQLNPHDTSRQMRCAFLEAL